MNVKIRNKFIEIKYSVSNGLVIFITNYRWFRILEISRYRRSNGCLLVGHHRANMLAQNVAPTYDILDI